MRVWLFLTFELALDFAGCRALPDRPCLGAGNSLLQSFAGKRPRAKSRVSPNSMVAAPKHGRHCSPQFIHIPKVAGTAIEETLRSYGIMQGKYANWTSPTTRPYQVERFRNCPAHHRPPSAHVEGGLCIVREPISRALSEFCYIQLAWIGKDKVHFKPDCEGLNAWVRLMMDLAVRERHDGYIPGSVNRCHFFAQWRFARRADVIVSHRELHGQGWDRIKMHFGLPGNATLMKVGPRLPRFVQTESVQVCSQLVKRPGCLEDENKMRLEVFFKEDYEHLSEFF
eukprot:TRINITY_DN33144_c0_g1_i1.p1 TRINITY_DN33144_c0_g1~~TRINITY_DN33144_c0_g1_i1.p1  ORF type:complete len:283 (-),score=20.94 TRINITY_DN33144_c0_g1_i1:91-939(-)